MRILYEPNITMPDGRVWLSDYSVELIVSIDYDQGEPFLVVDDILRDVSHWKEPTQYVSMFSDAADPLMALLGHRIADMAQNDEDLLDEVVERECADFRASLGDLRRREAREAAHV